MLSARRLFGVVCAVVLPIAPARSAAQGWIEHPRGAIEKVRSAVQVNVTGRVARVTVEEWFRNTGALLTEANSLYPLPGEAVFSDFSLWQGDQELKGEPMDAAQARAIYEEIVRRKRDPALIELAGHGLLRARVFPIGAGETRKITLRYTQLLDRVGDAWRFRYTAGTGAGAAASASFRMQVDSGARFGDPYSPTHRLSTTRSDNRIELTLAETSGRGDLELFLPVARSLVGMSLVTSQPIGEDGFFMLLLAPGRSETPSVRRDLVAVLDVSGSMSGDKLEQAKAALAQLLGTLRSGDRFRVVTFGSSVRRYATGWTDVSGDNVRAAQEWVRRLETDGGTNIAGALGEAFAEPPAEGRLGVVVFLTDGMATVGETSPERIADQAERGRGPFRVFAFGIGYDVNTYLLDRLTERARGVTEYIRPGGDIEQTVASLASKIASPGREERFRTAARFGGEQAAADYVQQLWAARKAGALSSDIRLHGPNPETVSELKRLALRYGILTEYTSYLVQEPSVVARPMPLQAPAPQDQAGAEAVQRSRREKALTGSLLRSEVVVTGRAADSLSRGGAATENKTRQAAGRVFVWRDSTWTDIAHGDSLRVVNVAAFSDAYFALLRALPELMQAATLEPAVLVAGRRVSIKIGASGKTTWTDGELERLVREFHG